MKTNKLSIGQIINLVLIGGFLALIIVTGTALFIKELSIIINQL